MNQRRGEKRGVSRDARESESNRQYVPLVVLHDAATGHRVCVSGMWFTTFAQGDHGTTFRFTNGETLTVEEGFDAVAFGFQRGGVQ